MSRLSDRLELLLVDEPPYLARDGGFITAGAHAPLDEMRALRDESRRVIAGLEGKYRQESGVAAAKIKHNGVLGYFIEVDAAARRQADGAMRETFRHRQTMAGAVRFSTDELATLASRIAEAGEQALALEARAVRRDGGAGAGHAASRCRPSPTRWRVLDVAVGAGRTGGGGALCAAR